MSIKLDFKRGMDLLTTGRRKEAVALLLPLCDRVTERRLKLKLIDALLTALNPVDDNQKLIELSSEGVELAKELNLSGVQAHFMGRKAHALMQEVTLYEYQIANLTLSPNWFQFATEADRNAYEILRTKVGEFEVTIEGLLTEAKLIAQRTGDKKTLAFVLLSRGQVESMRYFQYKLKLTRGRSRAQLVNLMHKVGYETPLVFGLKNYKKLTSHFGALRVTYLEAARLLEEIGDVAAGSAYFDLALCLKSAYKLREARKYLHKAKKLAKEHKDGLLMAKTAALEESIKARNRDTPNYVEGERPEDITI